MQKLTLVALSLLSIIEMSAQDMAELGTNPIITSATKVAEETEVVEEPSFTITGFVDAYYAYFTNEEAFPTSFTEAHNSFTLGMANVVFAKEGKVGFKADLAVGPRAEVANGYNGSSLSAIKQLYVTYTPVENLTLTLGNFGTHVGYEVIDAPENINYSTSYMFSNGPFFHTGLKADYAISENFGVMIGVLNDTDTKMDVVPGKHFAAQLSYSDDKLGAYLNFISGKAEESEVAGDIMENQIDLTATFQATEAIGLGLNTTVKTLNPDEGDNTSWFGAAIYANYSVSESLLFGFRGEYIGDDDGLISGTTDNSIVDLTLSANIKVEKLTIIPEFRIDIASEDVFFDSDGEATGTSAAFIMAAMYAF